MQLDSRFIKVAHDPGDPQLCAHCPFCGSGQITGRSDGGIDCAFCGMSFIVRVQPAFAGMPQAPGMGAPTDIGPDMPMGMPGMDPMGELPPGEEGGMPPGAEGDEEGGPPFGGDDEEEEGPPGDDEDSEDDEDGKDDDAPPFARKKGSRRVYRTLSGDRLDERRYIRHLAVLHSGADPGVLAKLRREAILRYTPHVREVLPLHMMSHHGWSPAEVREALEWPEGANALPAHHDREHAPVYAEHLHLPHKHEDVTHSVGEEPPPDAFSDEDRRWLGGGGFEASRRLR